MDFNLLLEKAAAKHEESNSREKSLKESVRELTMKHQNFNNALKEMSEQYCQFHIPLPEKCNQSEAIAVSLNTFVHHLDEQATISHCTIEDVAYQVCPKMLLDVSMQTTEDGLLTDEAHFAAEVVLTALENISKKKHKAEFSRYVVNICKNVDIPLNVLWLFITHSWMDMEQYLLINSNSEGTITRFTKSVAKAAGLPSSNIQRTKQIISDFLGFLIVLGFSEQTCTKEESQNNLKNVASIILDTMIKMLLDMSSATTDDSRLNIYELLIGNSMINLKMLQKFSAQHIVLILTHNRTHKVTKAIGEHSMWSYSKTPRFIGNLFKELLKPFQAEQAKELLQRVVEQNEVNWKHLLMFVSHVAVLFEDGPQMLRELIQSHVAQAFQSFELDRLISAFLLARHAGLEGSHVFPSYSDWFHGFFGDLSSSPANNKKGFSFLMKFLSDFVPFEPSRCLKVHLLHPPAVPSKCRSLLSDYVLLAKLRLKDLKESIDDVGLYGSPSTGEGNEAQQKLLEQAQVDVEKALQTYEKVGKIPANIMEASIFRKPYYVGRFLPALLIPRPLPDAPDLKMKFSSDLLKAGKIPPGMYQDYESACKAETAHLLDGVFTSDPVEDLLLEPLEDLQESLVRFIGLVLRSGQSHTTTGNMSDYISTLILKLQQMVGEEEFSEEDSVVDMSAPEINQEHVTVVDLLLNNFCHVTAALSTVKSLPDTQWAAKFVSIFLSLPVLQKPLFYRLWELIVKQNVLLSEHHIRGLAAFLVHLASILHSANCARVHIIHQEIDVPWSSSPCTNLVDTIFRNLPLSNSESLEFSMRICAFYLEYSVTSHNHFTLSYYECSNKAYIPAVLLQKFLYLVTRCYPLAREMSNTVSPSDSPVPVLLFKSEQIQNFLESQKIVLKDWISVEYNIDPYNDQLSDSDRLDYMLWFIKQSYNFGKETELPEYVLFRFLVEKNNQNLYVYSKPSAPTSRYVLLLCLQTLLLETTNKKMPLWILRELKKMVSSSKCAAELRIQLAAFFNVTQFLPPYLLLVSHPGDSIVKDVVIQWSDIISNVLRNCITEEIYLNFTITSSFVKALLHTNVTPENDAMMNLMLSNSPLLLASLVVHWPGLKIYWQRDLSQGTHFNCLVARINSCLQWVKRVIENGDCNSTVDVEDWLVAFVLAVKYLDHLRAPNRQKEPMVDKLHVNIQKYFYLFLFASVANEALAQEIEVLSCPTFKSLCKYLITLHDTIQYCDDGIFSLPVGKKLLSQPAQQLCPVVTTSILLYSWGQQTMTFQQIPHHIELLLRNHAASSQLLELRDENKVPGVVFNMHTMVTLDQMMVKIVSCYPRKVVMKLSNEIVQSCDSHIRDLINNKLM